LKAVLFFLCILSLLIPSLAPAQLSKDIQEHPTCKYCEMNRQHFAHSRMLIEYDDNSSFGACSLHCAAIDLAIGTDKIPVSIEVADYNTHELMDAEDAYWVIGGNKPGVMTQRAKWAFRKKQDAELFIKWNGGVLATFDDAIEATFTDMHEDSKVIRGKRKIRKMHRNMTSSCELDTSVRSLACHSVYPSIMRVKPVASSSEAHVAIHPRHNLRLKGSQPFANGIFGQIGNTVDTKLMHYLLTVKLNSLNA
jgi:copper chaperone NosL